MGSVYIDMAPKENKVKETDGFLNKNLKEDFWTSKE